MTDALVLTVLGMGTVLVVLFAISVMIRLLGKLVGNKAPKPAAAAPAAAATKAAPAAAAAPKADDNEVIAVISAAVAAYLGTAPKGLYIRNTAVSGIWASASRLENTKKF